MTWNYRIVRHSDGYEPYFIIHVAFYDKDSNQMRPCHISITPVPLHGRNLEELKTNLEYQLQAFTKPVLNFEDF